MLLEFVMPLIWMKIILKISYIEQFWLNTTFYLNPFFSTNYLSNIIKLWRSSKSRTHWIPKFKYRWSLSESAVFSLCGLRTRWNTFYCTLEIKKISQIKMYAKFLIIISVKTKIPLLFSVNFANWKPFKQSKQAKLWLFKNENFVYLLR